MTKVVQDFLWAQKVQEPVALFSDWLHVGHIDEFMTFVPAPDRKVNICCQTETRLTTVIWKMSNSKMEDRVITTWC